MYLVDGTYSDENYLDDSLDVSEALLACAAVNEHPPKEWFTRSLIWRPIRASS